MARVLLTEEERRQRRNLRARRWRADNPEKVRAAARAWRMRNLDRARARESAWRANNPEKVRAKDRAWLQNNADKKHAWGRQWREKNREKKLAAVKEWVARNADRKRATLKSWREKNRERIRESARKARANASPAVKLRGSIKSQLNAVLRGKASRTATIKTFGFTMEQLVAHLESKFTDGMTWGTYGARGWHVDHVRPVSSFKFLRDDGSVNHEQIRACYALENLQPLWAPDNFRKGARVLT